MSWYLAVLKNYVGFSGRARRTEYWMFVLFNIVISLVLGGIGAVIEQGNILSSIYALAVLIPGLAVAVRRLHDTGRSGWWLLIGLVPLIGFIVLLVFMASEGEPGGNAYGSNPKFAPGLG
ncbi:DUF805 domain-containing protein [Streptosporangium amethystogenes]|uniref:DUF805 domain-containing protein n=1 Tax=Streptosporangium amethystogenes TaxID=2002 RepID=UPI0004C82F4A|nr:DUF805 domain-containing protein [Streptosporangium amethystogenes]